MLNFSKQFNYQEKSINRYKLYKYRIYIILPISLNFKIYINLNMIIISVRNTQIPTSYNLVVKNNTKLEFNFERQIFILYNIM